MRLVSLETLRGEQKLWQVWFGKGSLPFALDGVDSSWLAWHQKSHEAAVVTESRWKGQHPISGKVTGCPPVPGQNFIVGRIGSVQSYGSLFEMPTQCLLALLYSWSCLAWDLLLAALLLQERAKRPITGAEIAISSPCCGKLWCFPDDSCRVPKAFCRREMKRQMERERRYVHCRRWDLCIINKATLARS